MRLTTPFVILIGKKKQIIRLDFELDASSISSHLKYGIAVVYEEINQNF